jgi:isoprenylcysteine carboxyl methyltransferase (ICMT) family protein YpbQ
MFYLYKPNIEMKTFITTLLISILTVLAPVKAFIITTGLFVLSDTALAIYWTITKNGISSFRSNKFFNIAVKSFFYFSCIILAFLVDKFIFEASLLGVKLLLTKAMSLLFIYSELKSIDETSIKLGNKSIWKLLKELFNKGKELKKDLGDIVEDKKEDEQI